MPCRGLLVQGLVGPFVVVVFSENIETLLLLQYRFCRRLEGVFFESAVHAFVTTILLRFSRPNALRGNAVLNPHDRQARQPQATCAGKGNAVVSANGVWQTIVFKGGFEKWYHRIMGCSPQRLAA